MAGKHILVLNLGSTSFKFKLYRMDGEETALASGGVESIGADGRYQVRAAGGTAEGRCVCQSHLDAMELCLEACARLGQPMEPETLDAVGYKAVHGGAISGAHRVDDALLAEMERMVSFAPAHNPVYLRMMRAMGERYPALKQIACFETAFHAGMPPERAVYGVPYEWVERYGVRRYGFHGSSHSYIAWKLASEAPGARRVISAHLGGSSSLCAILDGRSIACSMGATPQSGLFQNNRVGDLDAFVLPILSEKLGGTDAVMKALSTQGGFLGLSGVSNDLRLVEEAATQGNARAALAIRAFEDAIVGYIGMFAAYLGGLDALAFTGGIGMNDAMLRERIARRLGWLGVALDDRLNQPRYEGRISPEGNAVTVWSLETNEELMVARGCLRVLAS